MNRYRYTKLIKDNRKKMYDLGAKSLKRVQDAKIASPKQPIPYGFYCDLNKINYGIELECEVPNQYDRTEVATKILLNEYFKNLYICSDGSLNYGIELVTLPHTEEFYTKNYGNLRAFLKHLSKLKLKSHDTTTCGLHIHIGYNDNFTRNHSELLSKFVTDNKNFFRKLSRRAKSQLYYCKFNGSHYDRYTAINLTNKKTCEIRFFRGTLNPETFIANLELSFSLIHFVKSINFDTLENFNLKSFKKFIKNSKYYYLKYYISKIFPRQNRSNVSRAEMQLRKQQKLENRIKEQNKLFSTIQSKLDNFIYIAPDCRNFDASRPPTTTYITTYKALGSKFKKWEKEFLKNVYFEIKTTHKAFTGYYANSYKNGELLTIYKNSNNDFIIQRIDGAKMIYTGGNT